LFRWIGYRKNDLYLKAPVSDLYLPGTELLLEKYWLSSKNFQNANTLWV